VHATFMQVYETRSKSGHGPSCELLTCWNLEDYGQLLEIRGQNPSRAACQLPISEQPSVACASSLQPLASQSLVSESSSYALEVSKVAKVHIPLTQSRPFRVQSTNSPISPTTPQICKRYIIIKTIIKSYLHCNVLIFFFL
jgi:hypothetical protein